MFLTIEKAKLKFDFKNLMFIRKNRTRTKLDIDSPYVPIGLKGSAFFSHAEK